MPSLRAMSASNSAKPPSGPVMMAAVATGCAACCNGCPKGAIRMVPDREGFLYPQVTDGCVQCGHCTHICPVLKQREPRTEPAAFIVWNGDEAVRRDSTAGGAFSALAEYVLEGGGVVFGAAEQAGAERRG